MDRVDSLVTPALVVLEHQASQDILDSLVIHLLLQVLLDLVVILVSRESVHLALADILATRHLAFPVSAQVLVSQDTQV